VPDDRYRPLMSADRAGRLRRWHEAAQAGLRARLPARLSFRGLDLVIPEDVFAPGPGEAFHRAVLAEVRPTDRVLDMGTGSGVVALLAASVGAEVVAVDINPRAVGCARANAARNGLSDHITFLRSDVFDAVPGAFDLIVFDPPFRWFGPRDLLEASSADKGYRALTRFMAEVRDHLRPGGRILLNFGTSGDIAYLHRLIHHEGFKEQVALPARRPGTA
jgi:release factor glutamine methyltransferase